jgi:hypothetical protein
LTRIGDRESEGVTQDGVKALVGGDMETLTMSLGRSPSKVALDDTGIWYYQIKQTVFRLEI